MHKRVINLGQSLGCWTYSVGRGSVRFTGPNGKSFHVSCGRVTGRTEDTFARGRWKQTTDGMVTPRDIRRFLETNDTGLKFLVDNILPVPDNHWWERSV